LSASLTLVQVHCALTSFEAEVGVDDKIVYIFYLILGISVCGEFKIINLKKTIFVGIFL